MDYSEEQQHNQLNENCWKNMRTFYEDVYSLNL